MAVVLKRPLWYPQGKPYKASLGPPLSTLRLPVGGLILSVWSNCFVDGLHQTLNRQTEKHDTQLPPPTPIPSPPLFLMPLPLPLPPPVPPSHLGKFKRVYQQGFPPALQKRLLPEEQPVLVEVSHGARHVPACCQQLVLPHLGKKPEKFAHLYSLKLEHDTFPRAVSSLFFLIWGKKPEKFAHLYSLKLEHDTFPRAVSSLFFLIWGKKPRDIAYLYSLKLEHDTFPRAVSSLFFLIWGKNPRNSLIFTV